MRGVDYYQVLGVPRTANTSDIKARYQALAKKYHPDQEGDDGLMGLVNEAYQVLSDPKLRFNYNRTLHQKPVGQFRLDLPQTFSAPTNEFKDKKPKTRKKKLLWAAAMVIVGILIVGSLDSSQPAVTPAAATQTASGSPAISPAPEENNTPSVAPAPISTPPATTYSKPVSVPTYTYTPPPVYTSPASTYTTCSSNNIGSSSYTNCYGGGGSASCTTNTIGSTGYTNCYGSGGSTNCTTNSIGDSDYTNCY